MIGALRPGVDGRVLERGGEAGRPAVGRAEAPRERLRAAVRGVDAVHQLVPFQEFDREVARGDRALERIAAPGEFRAHAIGDLGSGPAVWLPWAEAADPFAGVALDHRKHRKAADVPRARDRGPVPPGLPARPGPAETGPSLGCGAHLFAPREI